LLQTVVAVAAEKNSTLVLPFPVELLRFLERAQPGQQPPAEPVPASSPAPAPAPVEPVVPLPVEPGPALPDLGAADSEAGAPGAPGASRIGQD